MEAEAARVADIQAELFPVRTEEVLESLGADLSLVRRLHDRGWLSFEPALGDALLPSQRAEMVFLGSLSKAGCDDIVLERLLAGLERPYCYNVNAMYYDWAAERWETRGEDGDWEDVLASLLEEAIEDGDPDTIRDVIDSALQALVTLAEGPANNAESDASGRHSSADPSLWLERVTDWRRPSSQTRFDRDIHVCFPGNDADSNLLAVLSEQGLDLRLSTIEWMGHTPIAAWERWRLISWPEVEARGADHWLNQLQQAHDARLEERQHCGERFIPARMAGASCHGCAEQVEGVVF